MNFIAIGDNVADCYLHEGVYYPGGNAVNVAVNLKKCGAETVEYIGVFGTDDMASHIEKSINEEGVITNKCRKMIGRSGHPSVNIDENGERYFVGSPVRTVQRMASINLLKEEYEYLKSFDLVHTSCYSSIDHLLSKISQCTKLSYDFSDEHNIDKIRSLSKYVDYVFLSGSDLTDEQNKEIIKIAHESGASIVCITLGSKGAICSDGNKIYKTRIVETEIVDTMGAGDGFIAGFLYKYTETKNVQIAINFAAEVAAKVCRISGGFGHPKKLTEQNI